MALAVTVNEAEVAPLATVTEAGVVSRALLSETVTAVAEVAALLRVTVQVAEALEPRVVGEQAREERVTAEARVMVAVFETPLRVAVRIAD